MYKKSYEELEFTDDFLFCKILEDDKDLCKDIIELILGEKVSNIEYLTKQKEIKVRSDGRGIRLDVYVENENKVYDIEMQTVIKKNLPKRTRYYQSLIDSNIIDKNEDYSSLKETVIIFICLEDPFKADKSVYTFEYRCVEDLELKLGDQTKKLFLNASGNRENLSEGLAAFLDYLAGKKTQDSLTKRIEDKVTEAREAEKWKEEYRMIALRDIDIRGEEHDQMVDVMKRLKAGEDIESILSDGVDRETVDAVVELLHIAQDNS